MKNIMHNVSQALKKSGTEPMVQKVIDESLDYMIGFIREAETAREEYFTHPSIKNGAMRYEAEQKAKNAIEASAQHLWETWEREFRDIVTESEFITLIIQALKRLRPEGEEPIKEDGKYWIRYINNELFQPA